MKYLSDNEIAPLDGATVRIAPIGVDHALTTRLIRVHYGTFRAEPYGAEVYAIRMTPEGEVHASWRGPDGGYTPVVLIDHPLSAVKDPLTAPLDLSGMNHLLPQRYAYCTSCNIHWLQRVAFRKGASVIDGDLDTPCPTCSGQPTRYSVWFLNRDGE